MGQIALCKFATNVHFLGAIGTLLRSASNLRTNTVNQPKHKVDLIPSIETYFSELLFFKVTNQILSFTGMI
jgi:hypothetical protein